MTIENAPQDERATLLAMVQDVCTKSTIQNLLRDAKDAADSTIRVSGSKEQVIASLRSAMDKGAVQTEAVYRMLCSAEENGSQHIFYYQPRSEEVRLRLSDGNAVADSVLGTQWRSERNFPQFSLMPEGVVWSDFRIDESAGSASAGGWTAKLYAGLTRWSFIDEKDDGQGRVIRTYEKSLSREIYLVKWHNFGLLEMRVPRDSSSKQILLALTSLWEIFADGLDSENFEPLDLTVASRRLINEQSPENLAYRLGDAHFVDDQTGSARFASASVDDDIMSEPSREQAIRLFNTCRELAVVWLPTTAVDALDDELRTVIGKIRPNEVLIASRATTEAVDYVTYRLWQLTH